jgi:iron(II)-dependent oxidoreductase
MHEMALVPGGDVCLLDDTAIATERSVELFSSPGELVPVQSLYLDRSCVTNADFAKFVAAGGYSDPQLWPEEVLANVLQFTDSTGHPGPKHWIDGAPPADRAEHPVVGVCWYEANAYATWVGKRLPTTEEWQRAGTWPKGQSGNGTEQRFPWGNSFDPSKANTWACGLSDTVPVSDFPTGNTPNGIHQLIGNVWEWVDAQFYPAAEEEVSLILDETMAEIRGGAYDTYFHSQANCQFRTGQPLLFRGPNVGFRCCITANVLPAPAGSASANHRDEAKQ